jgi:hypothetical protein
MKTVSESQLISRVRAILNESALNESEQIIASDLETDESQMDNDIKGRAIEALRFVNGAADVSLLDYDVRIAFREGAAEELEFSGTGLTSEEEQNIEACESHRKTRDGLSFIAYKMTLPKYFRLVAGGSLQWNKRLTESESMDSAEYEKQFDYMTMGTPLRPHLFIDKEAGEDYYVACFCSDSSSLPSSGNVWIEYMVIPEWHDGSLYVSDKLEDALYYYLAGLVLVIRNDSHADDMFNLANAQMGIKNVEG